MLSQSAFNRRSRDLSGVLIALLGAVAEELGAYTSAYQAIDSVPVPLARRCRGDRHRLFADEASIGRGGSDRDFYYGCKLLVSVSDDGVITGFILAPASTEDRWVAESFLCWCNDPLSNPYEPSDLPNLIRGARSKCGLLSWVAAKIVAVNLGIWLNRYFGRPDLAFATLFIC